jgi:hypothetical protein
MRRPLCPRFHQGLSEQVCAGLHSHPPDRTQEAVCVWSSLPTSAGHTAGCLWGAGSPHGLLAGQTRIWDLPAGQIVKECRWVLAGGCKEQPPFLESGVGS